MSSEGDLLVVLTLLSFALLLFILAQQFSKQKLKQQISKLKKDLEYAVAKKEPSKEKKSKKEAPLPSTHSLQYIKKIEALESELRLQKKRVLETKAIAQEANRIKSEFLSNVRHEIRTPMNSIMVFADLLAQETMDEKLKSYTKNIAVSGQQLLSLVDDIIELSSVEGGIFDIEETPVDIRDLVQTIVDKQKAKALKKGLSVSIEIDERVPDTLLLDKEKVEEILTNLIENAIKFTDKGFVKIEVDVNQKNILKNAVNISFRVEDSGIGIEEKYLDRIFEIFEKPDSDDEKIRGAGLGLSINQKLARAMNGNIAVRSKPNAGSLFTFTLQNVEIALANANTKEFNDQMIDFSLIKTKHQKVIVIDKDEESRDILREAFLKTPVKVVMFQGSREAIAFLQKEPVDVLFIDIDILTEDDNAVAKILMKISSASIVTLTSHRLKDVVFAHGIRIAGHLMRPIALPELFKVTLKAVSESEKVDKKKEHIEEEQVSFEQINKAQKEAFLEAAKGKLSALYEEAYRTNDLKSIEKFAHALYTLAKEHHIDAFAEFAQTLLQKIELFDIDAMHSMMKEYKEKLNILKNL